MKRYDVTVNLNCIVGDLTCENMTTKAAILFTQSILDRYSKYGGLAMRMSESSNAYYYNETNYDKEVKLIDDAEKILYSMINKDIESIDDIFPVFIYKIDTWKVMLSTTNNDFYLFEYKDESGYKRLDFSK